MPIDDDVDTGVVESDPACAFARHLGDRGRQNLDLLVAPIRAQVLRSRSLWRTLRISRDDPSVEDADAELVAITDELLEEVVPRPLTPRSVAGDDRLSATARALPYGMQRAPDGTIWVALFGTNKLGHIDPATAKLTEIDLPDAGARPRRLALTSDGRVWYSDYARGYLGMYDPKTKAAREWKTPEDNSNPYGIGIAPDGAVWFNEARQGNMVRFDPATEKMEVVEIPTRGSVIRNVTIDSTRHRLWIAESGVSRLGRIDLK